MVKDGIKRTAIMTLVYLLCVGAILGILIHNFQTYETDYSQAAQGTWVSLEYFKDKSAVLYEEDEMFEVCISGDSIFCEFADGSPAITGTFHWKNGYSGNVTLDNGFQSFVSVDVNTRGDLKLNITEKAITIILQKKENQ